MPKAPAQHRKPGQKTYSEREKDRKRAINLDRASSYQRGYDNKWREYRLGFLRSHPLCKACEAQGRLTQANVVDHIKDHRGDQRLFWDANNHQALCKSCHDAKTARDVLNYHHFNQK
jgi:5-methylcytosine-specific restriction protein A